MFFSRSKRGASNRKPASQHRSKRARQRRFESLEPRALLTTVTGDFNHDGFADLVIGRPGDGVGGIANAGAVQVIYGGSDHGLDTDTIQRWTQDSSGIRDAAQTGDRFGAALAVGDFNKDGFADLAIGAPGDGLGSAARAGVVHILFGSSSGLRSSDNQLWTQDSSGIAGAAQTDDAFGAALVAADFNRDGFVDLAIGAPGDHTSGLSGAGAVNLLFGGSSGLKSSGNQLWHQDVSGINSAAAANDKFGTALAAGDFDADGFIDLAVGVPGKRVSGKDGAGGVSIIRGAKGGLTASGDQFWTAATTGMLGKVTENGAFGAALAAGDFNDNSRADLAIGAPGEDISTTTTAITSGAVHVLYGITGGLAITNTQIFTENTSGFTSSGVAAANGDQFGAALFSANFNINPTQSPPFQDRRSDLAIGVPGRDTSTTLTDVGVVRLLNGGTNGLSTSGTALIRQGVAGVFGNPAAGDKLGASVVGGDFNGDGNVDFIAEMDGKPGMNTTATGGFIAFVGASTGVNTGQGSLVAQRGGNGLYGFLSDLNKTEGKAFLDANKTKPGVITTASGLQYKINTVGSGTTNPTDSNSVQVSYTGKLIDGTVFDSSTDATFAVTGVIKGFTEALKLMHVGDEFTIYIPSELAYGTAGSGAKIGQDAVLIFDLKLLSIV